MRPLCDLALDVVIKVEYNSMRMLESTRQDSKHTFKIPETNLSYLAATICVADLLLLAKHVTGGDVQGQNLPVRQLWRDKRGNTMQVFSLVEYCPRVPCRYGMLLAKALGKEKAKIEKAFLVFLNISLLTRLLS